MPVNQWNQPPNSALFMDYRNIYLCDNCVYLDNLQDIEEIIVLYVFAAHVCQDWFEYLGGQKTHVKIQS